MIQAREEVAGREQKKDKLSMRIWWNNGKRGTHCWGFEPCVLQHVILDQGVPLDPSVNREMLGNVTI